MSNTNDPIALAQALIRCPSVTPNNAGCLEILGDRLAQTGFDCHRMLFADADTLLKGMYYILKQNANKKT